MNVVTIERAQTALADLRQDFEAFETSRFWSLVQIVQTILATIRGQGRSDMLRAVHRSYAKVMGTLHDPVWTPRAAARAFGEFLGAFNQVRATRSYRLALWLAARAPASIRWHEARLDEAPGPDALAPRVAAFGGLLKALIERTTPSPYQPLPAFDDWPRRPPLAEGATPIDVVVPVYGGLTETLACLHSALKAHSDTAFELIVLNDSSPDPALVEALEALAATGRFTLLRNERNLGFVGTVNRGMTLHPEREIVLLNADTVVFDGWLDRIVAAAAAPDVGTVTPLSNNATICSYPLFCQENDLPGDASAESLAALTAKVNDKARVAIPTAVGFCMYIRRATLDEVGLFDEESFGRGYGEENDFCQRASKKGWAHLLATDTFVYHHGSVSFQGEATEKKLNALRILAELHPEYDRLVHTHIGEDPAFASRRRLDVARLNAARGGRPAVLLVNHGRGGGTAQHVLELCGLLKRDGVVPILLEPWHHSSDCVVLSSPGMETPNTIVSVEREAGLLIEILSTLEIAHIHFHHVVDLPATALDLPARLGVPYDVTLHDYFMICPQINLIGPTHRYCGEPELKGCNVCLRTQPSGQPGGGWISQWRADWAAFLAAARRVFVPDTDVAERLARYLPDRPIAVRAHFDQPAIANRPPRPATDGVRRVAILGGIGRHKGAEVLLACAADATRRKLPLVFEVIGYTCFDDLFASYPNVRIHGAYANHELGALFAMVDPDLCFLPSVWPETYGYTLSLVIAQGVMPVVFEIGAMARRLKALGWGETLALDLSAAEINDRLLAMEPVALAPERRQGAFLSYASATEYYEGLPGGAPGQSADLATLMA